jgi:hypothetical protein
MSTAIGTTTDQKPPKVPEQMTPQCTEPKFTAVQIEKGCPARLQEIGRKIAELFEEAREQTKRLDDRVIAINKLIAEAQELCDGGGYAKFRELFCPQLAKSQAYVRLGIAAGKTTLVEHRAKERERKRRTRAKQKAAAVNSGTVPERSAPLEAYTDDAVEPASIAPDEKSAKPPSAVASDEAMRTFTRGFLEVDRVTDKKPVERFSKTTIPFEKLARLGSFLTELAKIKKSGAVKAAAAAVVPSNGANSAELHMEADQCLRNGPLAEVGQ